MTVSGINRDRTYNEALSRREVALLAEWERERRKHVTREDLAERVGSAAAKVAAAMVRKGALQRLQRGLYLVRPFRSLLRPTMSSAPAAAASLLHAELYYLGGLWAYSHHGFTEQQYASKLDAFVSRRRPARNLPGARIVFHPRAARAFEYGVGETAVEGLAVRVSDPERTLVDMLDFPGLAGGLQRAVALFTAGLPLADVRKIAEYAVRGSRSSTCQRVGVILERRHAPAAVLKSLKRRIKGTRSVTSLIPGRRKGPVNPTWNVVENDRALDATAAS